MEGWLADEDQDETTSALSSFVPNVEEKEDNHIQNFRNVTALFHDNYHTNGSNSTANAQGSTVYIPNSSGVTLLNGLHAFTSQSNKAVTQLATLLDSVSLPLDQQSDDLPAEQLHFNDPEENYITNSHEELDKQLISDPSPEISHDEASQFLQDSEDLNRIVESHQEEQAEEEDDETRNNVENTQINEADDLYKRPSQKEQKGDGTQTEASEQVACGRKKKRKPAKRLSATDPSQSTSSSKGKKAQRRSRKKEQLQKEESNGVSPHELNVRSTSHPTLIYGSSNPISMVYPLSTLAQQHQEQHMQSHPMVSFPITTASHSHVNDQQFTQNQMYRTFPPPQPMQYQQRQHRQQQQQQPSIAHQRGRYNSLPSISDGKVVDSNWSSAPQLKTRAKWWWMLRAEKTKEGGEPTILKQLMSAPTTPVSSSSSSSVLSNDGHDGTSDDANSQAGAHAKLPPRSKLKDLLEWVQKNQQQFNVNSPPSTPQPTATTTLPSLHQVKQSQSSSVPQSSHS